jgi:hypothetical protein
MRGFGSFVLLTAITAALIPWPEIFPLWVGVILLVFFVTLPERSEPRSRVVKRTRGSGS